MRNLTCSAIRLPRCSFRTVWHFFARLCFAFYRIPFSSSRSKEAPGLQGRKKGLVSTQGFPAAYILRTVIT